MHGTAREAIDCTTIRLMRFACWITKTRHILGIRNTYCFCTETVVSRMRLNVTFIRILPVLL